MSNIVTLKTEMTHRFGKTVKIGDIDVKFDQFGMVDVVERHVETLIQKGLIPVDASDVEKYKKLSQPAVSEIAAIDVKIENDSLKKQIELQKKEIESLKSQLALSNQTERDPAGTNKNEDSETKENGKIVIDKLSKEKLLLLCKESNLPENEWIDLTVIQLKSYLKEKLI
jgi:hypothetical protein